MNRIPWTATLIVVFVLTYWGACAATTVSCWHRDGTVIKNWIDWPTCVEIARK